MVWEDGRRIIRPMRYQSRPAGKPAAWDRRPQLRTGADECVLRERQPSPRRRTGTVARLGRTERRAGVPATASAGHARRLPVVALAGRRGIVAVVCRDHRRAAAGRSPPSGMIAAWSRSARRTSMTGWMLAVRTWPACTRSSRIGNVRTTSTGWPPDRSGGVFGCGSRGQSAGDWWKARVRARKRTARVPVPPRQRWVRPTTRTNLSSRWSSSGSRRPWTRCAAINSSCNSSVGDAALHASNLCRARTS